MYHLKAKQLHHLYFISPTVIKDNMFGLSLAVICFLAGATLAQDCDPNGERTDCGKA